MQGGQFRILTMIMQGGYATYPLLLISIVCVTIIIERIWTLWGVSARASSKAETLIGPLRQGKFNEALKQVENPRNPRERLQDVDEERRYAEQLQLRGLIWVLATSGASAPFIGLFGTVVGILAAFQSMAVMGTGGFSVVAAGISEALISTALGLAVAIIAVIFYNYFSQKVERINATIHICAARLIDAAMQGQKSNGH